MFDFIKRCFKYPTIRELINSYKKQPLDAVKINHIDENHLKVTIDSNKIPVINLSKKDRDRYWRESEKELRKIERDTFLEQQAQKMREIVVAVFTVPNSIHSGLVTRKHAEIQQLQTKDFNDSARIAYLDMFRGAFRLLETPGARHFFSIYRANRHLSLEEIFNISQNSK